MEFTYILIAILSGLGYSIFWYLNKVIDPTSPTALVDIDPYPLLATGIIGACLGGYMVLTGGEVTQASIELQVGLYVTLTAVIERGLKTIVRVIKDRGGVHEVT